MSDFLSRLAARALGTATVVQPRLPARFEPTAGFVETVEVTSAREPDAASAPEPAPVVPPAVAPARAEALSPRPPGETPGPPSPAPPAERVSAPPASPPPDTTRSAARFVTVEEKRERRDPLPRQRATREEHVTREDRPPVAPAPAPPPNRKPLEIPAHRASLRAPSEPAARLEPEPTQTIEVTIGRVEVRAIHQAPAPPREAPARRGPSLTLDDYLKQRSGGR